jgi:uroporphyrinogen decarboxylase
MGDDVRMTWVNNNWAMEGVVHERAGESHVDPWGVRWVKEGDFNQPVGFPLSSASRQQMLSYEFPYGKADFLLHLMDPLLTQKESFFIGCDVSPCIFEMYWRLRGLENAILDIAMDQDLTRAMFEKCAQFILLLSRRACAEFPIDWL